MKHHYQRGAILVETTLVVTFMLTIVLFALELGLLGFLQVTADAAAFFDAHANIVGVSVGTPEQATKNVFSGLVKATIAPNVVPAPTPSIAVNYGYNDPNQNQADVANNRHGGISMMQPVQLQSTVTNTNGIPLTGTGKGPISVTSQETEAKWTECGPHYNVANENYDCGDTAAPANSDVTYQDAEYTPPYYVGYNFFTRCENPQPWGDTSNGYALSSTCTATQLDALGMGEYLYDKNWNASNPGVGGTIGSSTFQAAACHQRVYADLAGFLANYPNLSDIYSNYTYLQNVITTLVINKNFSDFRQWSEFNDGGAGTTADQDIQSIYDWDVYIDTGYPPTSYTEPGQYPLNPLGNTPNSTAGTQTAPISC